MRLSIEYFSDEKENKTTQLAICQRSQLHFVINSLTCYKAREVPTIVVVYERTTEKEKTLTSTTLIIPRYHLPLLPPPVHQVHLQKTTTLKVHRWPFTSIFRNPNHPCSYLVYCYLFAVFCNLHFTSLYLALRYLVTILT